jgi:hypothetical protein
MSQRATHGWAFRQMLGRNEVILVDDDESYQRLVERRIQEMYPHAGLQFLKDLKRALSRTAVIPDGVSIPDPV